MQGFAQIGLGNRQAATHGFKRGVRQTLINQHQLAQVTGWNVERARRVASWRISAAATTSTSRCATDLGMQLAGSAIVTILDPWRDQRHVWERGWATAARELEVRATINRPATTSMDTQWPVAIQPGDAGWRCNQMALFSAWRLRAIDQPARDLPQAGLSSSNRGRCARPWHRGK
jgi:hypothetical protein